MGKRTVRAPGCYAQDIAKQVLEKIREETDVTNKTSLNQIIFYFAPGIQREVMYQVKDALEVLQYEEEAARLAELGKWEALRKLKKPACYEMMRPTDRQLDLFETKK